MVAPTKCGNPEKFIDFYTIWNGVIMVGNGVNYVVSYNVYLIPHIKTPKIDNLILTIWQTAESYECKGLRTKSAIHLYFRGDFFSMVEVQKFTFMIRVFVCSTYAGFFWKNKGWVLQQIADNIITNWDHNWFYSMILEKLIPVLKGTWLHIWCTYYLK